MKYLPIMYKVQFKNMNINSDVLHSNGWFLYHNLLLAVSMLTCGQVVSGAGDPLKLHCHVHFSLAPISHDVQILGREMINLMNEES